MRSASIGVRRSWDRSSSWIRSRRSSRPSAGARARREGVRLAPLGSGGGVSVADRYVADFEAFAGNGAAGAPTWLKQIREGAIVRFAELGFPTTRQEEWRFTSVAAIADRRFVLAHAHRPPLPTATDIAPWC